MKIAVFSAKRYDREFLDAANAANAGAGGGPRGSSHADG